MAKRKLKTPNILIIGTPGVGKSSISKEVAKRVGFQWLNVGDIAKEEDCLESFDETYKCPIINEDRLVEVMEARMLEGGKIVEYHSCEFFPEGWFDAVFVVRTNNTILYDRLTERGYEGKKLMENIECEIFQTILEEARDSYKWEIIHELQNDSEEDLEKNINTVINCIKNKK